MYNINLIVTRILNAAHKLPPVASQLIVDRYGRDPFLLLIFCLLSLRTKDPVAFAAACRLFEQGRSPRELLKVDPAQIEQLIFPVGFYRRKAQTIVAISKILIEKYHGTAPSDFDKLVALPGVGPKTAQLVRSEGFLIPAICVDTHVHRVSNRLGLVTTKTVEETQKALESLVPPELWSALHRALVVWGQNICVPISPHCSICPVQSLCKKVGVTKHR
jgi:endonuclease III